MISNRVRFSPFSSSSALTLKKPPFIQAQRFLYHPLLNLEPGNKPNKVRGGACRAELSNEAPFVAAIGACMLNSLVFPVPANVEDDEDSVIDSTDTRLAVMGIMSFIPYFNWLSWVFAWLDTGKRRYAVYSLVYLAPYLKTNLSLSPEDSWLPIASILLCIAHIQLEGSIRNGDLQAFQLFGAKDLSRTTKKDDHLKRHGLLEEEKKREQMDLPSAEDQSRKKVQWWDSPKESAKDFEHRNNEDWGDDERK